MSENLHAVQNCNSKHFFVERQYTNPHASLKRKNTSSMKMTLFCFSKFIFLVLCLQISADNSLSALGKKDGNLIVFGRFNQLFK